MFPSEPTTHLALQQGHLCAPSGGTFHPGPPRAERGPAHSPRATAVLQALGCSQPLSVLSSRLEKSPGGPIVRAGDQGARGGFCPHSGAHFTGVENRIPCWELFIQQAVFRQGPATLTTSLPAGHLGREPSPGTRQTLSALRWFLSL